MEGKSGCAVLGVVLALVVIVAAALLVGKLAEYNDAETSRLYARGSLEESYGRAQAEIARAQADARAAIITAESQARLDQAIAEAQMVLAQGQARLDSAQAFAVTAGASLPWLEIKTWEGRDRHSLRSRLHQLEQMQEFARDGGALGAYLVAWRWDGRLEWRLYPIMNLSVKCGAVTFERDASVRVISADGYPNWLPYLVGLVKRGGVGVEALRIPLLL